MKVIISKNKLYCQCNNKTTYRNSRFHIQRRAAKIDVVNANTAMDDPMAMAREDVCSKGTFFPVLEVSEMKQQNMILCNNVNHFLRALKKILRR